MDQADAQFNFVLAQVYFPHKNLATCYTTSVIIYVIFWQMNFVLSRRVGWSLPCKNLQGS